MSDFNSKQQIEPVRLIVPVSPGGGTDIIARTLGQKLSETFDGSSSSITAPAEAAR